MTWAEIIVGGIGIYMAIGIIFALYFVIFRLANYDEAAKDSSVFFRLIIFFGAVVFWILLVFQILQSKERIEVTAHRV